MKRFRKGLVAGKFSPLHLGHEALIEYAAAQCEQVIILSYANPEFTKCNRSERERWIKGRFPQLEVLVLDQAKLDELTQRANLGYHAIPRNDADKWEHRQFVAWVLVHLLGTTVDSLFTSEDYGDRLAAHISDYFQKTLAKAPTVQHISYDKERRNFPISGTQVRADYIASQKLMSSNVFASLMPKLAILGGDGTGKTTLAKALAAELQTGWLSEFKRDESIRLDGDLRYEDILRIAKAQVKSELVLSRRFGNKMLVCDTTALSLLLYSYQTFREANYELHRLAERQYDYTVLCEPNADDLSVGQHEWYVHQLQLREMPYKVVTGSTEERVAQVREYVGY